jgi:hypothetical protein
MAPPAPEFTSFQIKTKLSSRIAHLGNTKGVPDLVLFERIVNTVWDLLEENQAPARIIVKNYLDGRPPIEFTREAPAGLLNALLRYKPAEIYLTTYAPVSGTNFDSQLAREAAQAAQIAAIQAAAQAAQAAAEQAARHAQTAARLELAGRNQRLAENRGDPPCFLFNADFMKVGQGSK